ncbi:MAG: ROK family transcriptional regulator [Kiritimatiellae bacterium]|nr:ROK family transcriptional regulator [Kiritimatiellia bacterium]
MTPRKKSSKRKRDLAFHERNLRTSILSLLRREGSMPRVLIRERLNLTPAMVTRCIQRLERESLVGTEGRSRGTGGRLCRNVALSPKAGYVIGIEYNPEEIFTAVVNFAGRLDKRRSFPLPKAARDGNPQRLLAALYAAIADSRTAAARSRGLLGIAAVDPGIVDTVNGVTVASNVLPKWRSVPVCAQLAARFGVPVSLSNTANAILAAVDRLEMNRRYRDALYIEYREGIACAVKANGQQVLGSRGMAGEVTDPAAPDARAANREASAPPYLEEQAGLRAMLLELNEARHPAFPAGRPHREAMAAILALAREQDKTVAAVVERAWRRIGSAFGHLVNVLNPAVVVLDPHFGQAGDAALQALKQAMLNQMVPSLSDQVEIVVSKTEEPAAPVGAALVLLDELTFSGAIIRKT